MTRKIQLLDCTLRDGGYINDWCFSEECYNGFTQQLQIANLDVIELGIMGASKRSNFQTKFSSIEEIPMPVKIEGNKAIFSVMMTGDEFNKMIIPVHTEELVDCIRFAFFKADWKDAIEQMRVLKDKGYIVFAQAMATFQYNDNELKVLVQEINKLRPDAFYIVDSFGTLYSDDIVRYANLVNEYLDSQILFGLHAHNNIQMANSNVYTFIECTGDRDIIVDGSINGMGRGAGNAQTEMIMHYLNKKKDCNYNEDIAWKLYFEYIKSISEKFKWGYLPEQCLVSFYETNPAYVWYLKNIKKIYDFQILKNILSRIPNDVRYTLKKDVIDKILE